MDQYCLELEMMDLECELCSDANMIRNRGLGLVARSLSRTGEKAEVLKSEVVMEGSRTTRTVSATSSAQNGSCITPDGQSSTSTVSFSGPASHLELAAIRSYAP